MLVWGLAAAAPILIHLWNRRRYHEVPWAAMRYLLMAMRKHNRRIQVEQWLLLAVRTLILVLLALALANPVLSLLPSIDTRGVDSGQTHFVIVLDASYSMTQEEDGMSRWRRAQEMAIQLVRDAQQGDGFSLVLMSEPPRVLIKGVVFDADSIARELAALEPLHLGANLSASLAEIQQVVQNAQSRHRRLQETKICFFTDLGRTTWDDVVARRTRAQLGSLADRATMVLFDVADGGEENLALTSVSSSETLVTVGTPLSIQAEVQNFGRETQQNVQVQLLVDDQPVGSQQIDRIEADGRATVSFPYRFETPGEHAAEVRLGQDRLTIDNRRWISLPVREAIRVLCVRGKVGAARELALALLPQPGTAAVRPEIVSESALLEVDLHDYDAVFLCNVGRFGRDEASVLADYVRGGGGLVFFLGDQTQAENYNQMLGGAAGAQRILSARVGEVVSESQYGFALDALQYEHPLLAPFRGYERSGLLTTPIWRYFRLEPSAETSRIALAFSNGDPAIVEELIGRGRSLMVATPASSASAESRGGGEGAWNDLAAWPSFVPLVHEMMSVAVSGRSENRNVEVGDMLEGALAADMATGSVRVATPADSNLEQGDRLQLDRSADAATWRYDRTQSSGIYRVGSDAVGGDAQLFAVNVDTRESDLATFDRDLLPSQFTSMLELQPGVETRAPDQNSQVFRILLGGVLGLVLLETLLAWLFGRSEQ